MWHHNILKKTLFWPLFNTITQEEKGRWWPYLVFGQTGDNLGHPPWNCVSAVWMRWVHVCYILTTLVPLQAAMWRMHATTSECVPKGTPSRRQCQKAPGISRLLQLPGNVNCYTIKTVISKLYCISCEIRQHLPRPCTVIIHLTKNMTHFSLVQFIARLPRMSGKHTKLSQAFTSQSCLT